MPLTAKKGKKGMMPNVVLILLNFLRLTLCWYIPIIPTLGKLRQKDCEL
jgi:hypothetical protein